MRTNRTTAAAARARLIGAAALLAGGAGIAVLAAVPAGAAQCGGTPAANCTVNGTATLAGGSLSDQGPATLSWGTTLNGLNQQLTDTSSSDTMFTANDPTGTNAGWTVTASATQFTTSGAVTLANSGTLVSTGSTSSETATTAPSAACASGSTCTLPTEAAISYPVAITTAASTPTPVAIYDANVNTGQGTVVIGGSTPVGWWVNVPANATAGTYTSVITLAISSAPV